MSTVQVILARTHISTAKGYVIDGRVGLLAQSASGPVPTLGPNLAGAVSTALFPC